MILRPLEPAAASSQEFLPTWPVVERIQRQKHASCWLITQPSHAALAAELAAGIAAPEFPAADPQILQAIALHDAGWGIPDAQAIMRSRSVSRQQPESFIETEVPQFVAAWEKSIETCQAISPAGGYIVSRHFWRLAEHRVKSGEEHQKLDRQKLEAFLRSEDSRQKKLAARQSLSLQQLELLTDLLQFCDLFSLYICCGAAESVVFPKYFGTQLKVRSKIHNGDTEKSLDLQHRGNEETEEYRGRRKPNQNLNAQPVVENQRAQSMQVTAEYILDPPVLKRGSEFVFAALRYPATKEESSREIRILIG